MISKLSSSEVLHFLIIVSLMLLSARLLGELCRKLKQPAIIGEVMAGIILGPSLLGSIFPNLFKEIFVSQPKAYGAYDGLANIGIMLLMFIAGFEIDLKQIRAQGKQAFSISMMGLFFPFAVGFAVAYYFYDHIFAEPSHNLVISAMFFGTALSITALSVITKILIDMNILQSKIGGLVLTAAMVDDFFGWILFSIILKMMGSGKEDASFLSIILVLVFVVFMLTIGRWGINKLLSIAQQHLKTGRIVTLCVFLCLVGAIVTEYLGVRGVFGAFLVGIAIGDSEYFSARHRLALHQFVVNVLAPLFFASIGLRLNFIENFDLKVVLIILGIACFAKLGGAWLGSRMSGMTNNESWAVAFGMNARGSQEVVLGLIALQAGIIDEQLFVGLVVMTIVTIGASGPLMRYFILKQEAAVANAKLPAELPLT
jgi:Kef-type K+ transport system membrane component KefB